MSDSTDPGGQAPSSGPSKEAIATVVVTMGLLAGLVWYIRPPRSDFKPAPLDALPEDCLKVVRPFVPSNVTEILDPPLPELDPETRARVLFRLNFEACPCGCNQSIADCRANHPQCKICRELATKVVEEVKSRAPKRK